MGPQINNLIKIIVVDDEQIVLSLVRDTLEDLGYEVETLSSAPEALQRIAAGEYDLIITDIRMPHMDGIELVRRAREIHPEMSVIFMTGYANLNTAKDAIKHGAADYIMKPFELHEMRQAVQQTIHARREAAQKDSAKQLGHLSDFNQMLLTAGDKKSLLTVSLRFAMMHCQAERGIILHWVSSQSLSRVISIVDDQVDETEHTGEALTAGLWDINADEFPEPLLVNSPRDHRLLQHLSSRQEHETLLPDWLRTDVRIAVVPILRASAAYGLMIIELREASPSVSDTYLRFLALAANQLAVSLENVDLLEEARHAFARLKELQDETIQLEKMASRGEMSAEIGHELNNFLAVASGSVSLLEHHLSKQNYSQLGKYVRAIADNLEKIKSFTSNLMDLTPISSQKEIIYFERLLAEVIDYLRPQRRFRDTTIEFTAPGRRIPFEADTIHIQQLLYNLFNNAADAMADCPKREITARILINDADGRFTVTIVDTGCGMAPEQIEKAFNQRFTTKRTGHGHGLIVCKRIIENHAGRIHVDSFPNQGTEIKIDFPMQVDPALELSAVPV